MEDPSICKADLIERIHETQIDVVFHVTTAQGPQFF